MFTRRILITVAAGVACAGACFTNPIRECRTSEECSGSVCRWTSRQPRDEPGFCTRVTALESLGLTVDPVKGRLKPRAIPLY